MISRKSVVARPSGTGVFDADFNTKLKAVGFNRLPRETITVKEMIDIYEYELFIERHSAWPLDPIAMRSRDYGEALQVNDDE